MPKPVRFEAEAFQHWAELRQAIGPYLQRLYAEIGPRFEGAETILDLAGGEGHTHDMLPDLSPHILTVDRDQAALARLREKYPGARTEKASLGKLPFDDNSIDAAISINGINRTNSRNEAEEVSRVLKPGGMLIFLYDIPFSMKSVVTEIRGRVTEAETGDRYDLPVINPATRTVDQVFSITRDSFNHPHFEETVSGQMALESVEELLEDDDWLEKIYGDPLKLASYAKLFTRLLAEVRNAAEEPDKVYVWDPYAPSAREEDMERFAELENLDTTIEILELEDEADEVHHIQGRAVSRLYVDELALPHITYRTGATSTRIKGRTPVFVVRKH